MRASLGAHFLHVHAEEELPNDDGRPIIEHRLAGDDHCQDGGRLELVKRSHDCDRVGGSKYGAKCESQLPVPPVWQHIRHVDGVNE